MARHFSCFREKLSSAKPRTGHRDYQAVTVSCLSPDPAIAPRIPGDIGHEPRDLNTGERDGGAEREYSQGEEKRAVSLRYCLVRTGAREAPGAVTRDVNSTCPGNWNISVTCPGNQAAQHQSSQGGGGGRKPQARSDGIQTQIIQSSKQRRNSHSMVIT